MRALCIACVTITLVGCWNPGTDTGTAVVIDGSSTVTPIMEAVAEEFGELHPEAQPTLATSGTGGGFERLIRGEVDIAMASRPIKPEEAAQLRAVGIEYIELPIAYDGLTVVVNPENHFVDHLTVKELSRIWEPNSQINNWSQVRSGFPDVPLKLYGPGTDSGTFDYFTEAIVGVEGASRNDYQASEDDNVLVTGVAGDRGALGYFGYAYYDENRDKLKAIAIDGGDGPVLPSPETIANGSYAPLSRPLLIYVKKSSAESNPTVRAMVEYLLGAGSGLVAEVGYIELPPDQLERVRGQFAALEVGPAYEELLGAK